MPVSNLPEAAKSWHRLLYLASLVFILPQLAASQNLTESVYDWAKVPTVSPASDNLDWVACFGGDFLCTRLEVPLDWADESAGTTKVAFVKYPSQNETAEDMVINFGGPGGSGVGNLLALAPYLAEIFGPAVNLVSFDPRGVNNTGPSLDCFPNDPSTKQIFESTYFRAISGGSSNALATQFYMAEAYGKWCNPVIGGPKGTAKYANTLAVANDLLAFAELSVSSVGRSKGEAKLWYMGYSYGTLLGMTFASLYPDRIGRMILDGVVNGEDYYNGLWKNNLLDADAVIEGLISTCFDAGKDGCALYENSTESITSRMSNIITRLQEYPIPVSDSSIVDMPVLATYADWAYVLLNGAYFPLASFPKLVQILLDLEQGQGESLMASRKLVFGSHCNEYFGYNSIQSMMVIGCVDAGGRNNITSLDQYREYTNYLKVQSKYTGEAWALSAISCRNMDVIPPKSGQFTGSLPPRANKTSFPILFVGNKADPVTPLSSAQEAASLFQGSGLVEIDGFGHTSLAAPSDCLFQRIQAYLAGSTLNATVTCQTNEVPFKGKLEGLAQLSQI